MHYCKTCRDENGWAYCRQAFATCDICGKEDTACYCSDADYLRIRKRITLTSALNWAEQMASRIAERKPDDVAETHLIMSHTIMEVQLEAIALRRDPDFLQSLYDQESMKELRLEVQKLHEQREHSHQRIEALKHERRVDNLARAERHWQAACAAVNLVRSLAHLAYDNLDDAEIRFSLLELK